MTDRSARELETDSLEAQEIPGGVELLQRSEGGRLANLFRRVFMVATLALPAAVATSASKDAAGLCILFAFGPFLTAMAGLVFAIKHRAYDAPPYLRIRRSLQIKTPPQKEGYRERPEDLRFIVDGRAITSPLRQVAVVGSAIVTSNPGTGTATPKVFFHVALVFEDTVVRVDTFNHVEDAESCAARFSAWLGLPRNSVGLLTEEAVEHSSFGMWGLTMAFFLDAGSYALMMYLAFDRTEGAGSSPGWITTLVVVLVWGVVHELVHRWSVRKLQGSVAEITRRMLASVMFAAPAPDARDQG
jgi:hypothetical protein